MVFNILLGASWRRGISIITAATVAAFGLVVIPQQSADAAPRARAANPKVTICHRTHATTNPYRKITVSANAVDGELNGPTTPTGANTGGDHAGSVHNGYLNGSGNNPNYVDPNTHYILLGSTQVRVFDPTYTYAANNKVWEDIIPPFTVERTQGQTTTTYSFPGLNWNAIGQAIYYGTTYNGVDYSGLCNETGAREYAQAEYNSWLADNPSANNGQITSKKQDIVQDLRDQEAEGDNLTGGSNFDNLPTKAQKPKGPNKPSRFNTLQSNLNTNNTNNPNSIKQALAGVVWKDMNRNGIQDAGEETFTNVAITIKDPVTGEELTSPNLGLTSGTDYSLVSFSSRVANPKSFVFATFSGKATFRSTVNTYTITTDSNGYFQVPYLPDGEWQVVVTTPDGWSYTYDSSGASDGDMPGTIVPVGGVGFAWAGLVYTGTAGSTVNSDGTITLPDGTIVSADGTVISAGLANTGVDGSWYVAGIIALQLIALGGILMWLRRRFNSN